MKRRTGALAGLIAAALTIVGLATGAGGAAAAPPNTGGGLVSCSFVNVNPNLTAIRDVASVYHSSSREGWGSTVLSAHPWSVIGYRQTVTVYWDNVTTRRGGLVSRTTRRAGLLAADVWLPPIHYGRGTTHFRVDVVNDAGIGVTVMQAGCRYTMNS